MDTSHSALAVITTSLTATSIRHDVTVAVHPSTARDGGDGSDSVSAASAVMVCDPPDLDARESAPILSVDLRNLFDGTGIVETVTALHDWDTLEQLTATLLDTGIRGALAARGVTLAEPFSSAPLATAMVAEHRRGLEPAG